MRILAAAGLIALASQGICAQDTDRDFSGTWRLNPARSDIRGRFDVPSGFLVVTQSPSAMMVAASLQEGGPSTNLAYPIAGKSQRSQAAGLTFNIATKWEGAALLTNVIVGGHADYSFSERWTRSHDGNRLTITRTIENRGIEVESTLAYDRSGVSPSPQASQPQEFRAPDTAPANQAYVLEAGTRILLRLNNSIDTRHSAPGDRLYLQTAMPVFVKGKLIVPQGSYVAGTITESERAGRVKGKSGLNLRFDTLTLPNGVSRDFTFRAGSVDGQGNLDRSEGKITGEGTKGKDAGTVAKTTAAGTGLGTVAGAAAGNLGMGVGVGAAAGAAAGLARVLSSRGKDVVIPQGTTMEMVLDRNLSFTEVELRPGGASRVASAPVNTGVK